MCSPGINGEGELRGQLANTGSPGKMVVKTECVCVCSVNTASQCYLIYASSVAVDQCLAQCASMKPALSRLLTSAIEDMFSCLLAGLCKNYCNNFD